jgi:hypothetical protein
MPALGDLFAPAYNPTDPQSVQAVQAWTDRNQGISSAQVEQTRMPTAGVNTGNTAGMVDPNALRSLAQGGPYDMNARRDAIAAKLQAQQQAAAAKSAADPWANYMTKMYGIPASAFTAGGSGIGAGGSGFNPYGNDIFQIPPGGA